MLQRAIQTITVILSLCLSAALLTMLFAALNPTAWARLGGEVHQGMHDFFGGLGFVLQQIGAGIVIVFVVGVVLGSIWATLKFILPAAIDLKHQARARAIHPGKYGAAQTMQYLLPDGSVGFHDLANTSIPIDANQMIASLRQAMQANYQGVNTIARQQKELDRLVSEIEYVDEDEDEDSTPQIAAPRSNPDECLMISDTVQPHADRILSGRGLVIGTSGSGKSNSTACIAEELGRLRVPFVLADTENEYQSLCDPRYLPCGKLAGLQGEEYAVTVENAERFGSFLLDHNLQVILNLQSYSSFEEAAQVMVNLIGGLRQWEEARANEMRIPCEFMLEEAVTWLPQNIKESPIYGTEAMNELQNAFFNDMVRKGRKRGLGLAVICQKIAEIDKRALQSTWKLLHRQSERPDLQHYEKLGISRDETIGLGDGEAFYFDSKMSKVRLQMRRRHSPHGADTPGLKSLKQYQSLARNIAETDEISFSGRNAFGPDPADPRNISEFPNTEQKTGKKGVADVPREIHDAILDLYRQGCTRTKIQAQLGLNGDQYWMIKVVCAARDQEMAATERRKG